MTKKGQAIEIIILVLIGLAAAALIFFFLAGTGSQVQEVTKQANAELLTLRASYDAKCHPGAGAEQKFAQLLSASQADLAAQDRNRGQFRAGISICAKFTGDCATTTFSLDGTDFNCVS